MSSTPIFNTTQAFPSMPLQGEIFAVLTCLCLNAGVLCRYVVKVSQLLNAALRDHAADPSLVEMVYTCFANFAIALKTAMAPIIPVRTCPWFHAQLCNLCALWCSVCPYILRIVCNHRESCRLC